MREVRESVALSSRGLARPAAGSLCCTKKQMQAPLPAPGVIPTVRTGGAKVLTLFFRVSVRKSKLVVWRHL